MIYKSQQIPNPAQDGDTYTKLKRGLYNSGFRQKKNYDNVKITAATKYWWNSYTINIVNGPSVTIPAGHFFAYDCTYPQYQIHKVAVIKKSESNSEFYDDSIDELLGGMQEKLGV